MVENNPNVKAFFFNNNIKPNSFKQAALKGSIVDELKKLSGKVNPSMKDIYDFVISKLGNQ